MFKTWMSTIWLTASRKEHYRAKGVSRIIQAATVFSAKKMGKGSHESL